MQGGGAQNRSVVDLREDFGGTADAADEPAVGFGTGSKLRFGILCQGDRLAAWEADCIERAVSSGHADPVLLLKDASRAEPPVRPPHSALYRLYRARWLMRRSRALREVDPPACLAGVEAIDGTDSAAVRRRGLDFILRFGSGAVGRDMVQAARFGVWYHDHGGSAAPCFRELLHGEATTEVSLRRLGGGAGASVLLHRGRFGTCKASWVNNVDRALFGCADFCARVCAEIRLGRMPGAAGCGADPSGARLRPDRPPTNLELVRCLRRTGSHMIAKLWELLFHLEIWNVGLTGSTVEEIVRAGAVDPKTVTWCKPRPPGCFVADPFAYAQNGEQHILVEDLDESGKGRIATMVPPHGPDRLELAVDLEHAYHMSYPCIFIDDGEIYCVPETYQAGRASLYKRAGGEWKLVRTMLEGLPIVDPTLFKHQGRYWLFFTLQDDGAFGNLRLHAHHAERLLGDWRPHALNPLKCDIGSSRPAGCPVTIAGDLHRPTQDCSQTYGGAVVMNRIVKLTPTEFEEVAVARIEPVRPGPYPDGFHTINSTRTGAVIDSKKIAFHPLAWRRNRGRLHEVFK